MKSFRTVGVMSGTSLDGIDAVLLNARPTRGRYRIEILAHHHWAYPSAWAAMARKIAATDSLRDAARFGVRWSQQTARVIRTLCRKASIPVHRIDAVGIHGQTVVHLPIPEPFLGQPGGITIQLADLSTLAVDLGVTVVGNFRTADLAAGGLGAPLAPHAHRLLFSKPGSTIAVQNMGGIGNVTLLHGSSIRCAFDTGPGNIWIDTTARWLTREKLRFDPHGRIARKGRASAALVRKFLAHRYFRLPPPKTAGWEEFGPEYLKSFLPTLRRLPLEDALATVTLATAKATVETYRRWIFPLSRPKRLILSGGGAHNYTLRSLLTQGLPELTVQSSEDLGVPVDQLEAVAFGLFAIETLRGRSVNEPAATGAKKKVLCGQIAWGNHTSHVDRLRTLLLR